MTSPNKLDHADLAALLPRLDLPADAAPDVAACVRVSDAVARLAERRLLVEAARLCAHALPAREAVWWAARCVATTAPATLSDADRDAFALAETWVRKPSDATRREAMGRAQAGGCQSAEAWVAVAAFWSGDSMSPPEQPKVPPASHLTGTAVSGSVILASVRPGADRQAERLTRFLASAHEIASGGTGYLEREVV